MTTFILTDANGQNYFEGRTFDRETALEIAKTISANERPYGVFLCPSEEGTGIEDEQLTLTADEIFNEGYEAGKADKPSDCKYEDADLKSWRDGWYAGMNDR